MVSEMKDNFDINLDFGYYENSSCIKDQLDSRPQDIDLMYKLANCLGYEKNYHESEDIFLQVAQQAEGPDMEFQVQYTRACLNLRST